MNHISRSDRFPLTPRPGVGRWRLRTEHLWTLLPLFFVAWMGFMHPIRLLDFWWHLKAGQIIVETRQIPAVDSFSFTRAGQPFAYVQYWLSEVSYYLMLRAGGLPLIIAFNTLLLVLSMWLVLRLCLEANVHRRMAVLCSLMTALVLGLYSNVRPQLYSIVLFVLFYWVLWQYLERRRDLLWMLPVLMVLWVNLHGGFVLGIGLVGLVWGCETLRRVLRGPGQGTLEPSALLRLGAVLLVTMLACLLNPVGWRMLDLTRQIQASPSVQAFVTEWQLPDIRSPEMLESFYGPLFLAVCVFLYSPKRLNLTELALLLVFAALGLQARRNSIWLVLVVTPMLARHMVGVGTVLGLGPMWQRLRRAGKRQLPEHSSPDRHDTSSAPVWVLVGCLIAITVLLSPWVRPRWGTERLRPQLVDQGTPSGAMEYMAAHHLVGNTFHPEEYGDYLIWRLWPQQKSFIDGRVHLFGEAFLQEYVLAFHNPSWEAYLARYNIRYLLLPKGDTNCAWLLSSARSSAHWAVLYEDAVAVLLELH